LRALACSAPAGRSGGFSDMRSRYLDVDDRTQDLADLFRGEPAIGHEFNRKYELSWVYHENALEGVIFSGQEIEHALESQPLVEASSVAALRDIRNFKAAVDVVRAEAATRKPKITFDLVKQLYVTLHTGIEARATPEFRKDIPLHRAYFHEIAPPAKIAALMAKLLEWCDSTDFRTSHPIQSASKLQHGFMQIYPYTDASGKIARLLSNVVLLHHRYQPCIIHTIDRQRYYESLRLPEPQLREIILEAMENSLANGEKFLRLATAARSKMAR
jgi:Fic family protein